LKSENVWFCIILTNYRIFSDLQEPIEGRPSGTYNELLWVQNATFRKRNTLTPFLWCIFRQFIDPRLDSQPVKLFKSSHSGLRKSVQEISLFSRLILIRISIGLQLIVTVICNKCERPRKVKFLSNIFLSEHGPFMMI